MKNIIIEKVCNGLIAISQDQRNYGVSWDGVHYGAGSTIEKEVQENKWNEVIAFGEKIYIKPHWDGEFFFFRPDFGDTVVIEGDKLICFYFCVNSDETKHYEVNPTKTDFVDSFINKHVHILLSDAHGVYIPQAFARQFEQKNVKDEDWKIILSGPDEEHYWEAWEEVIQTWEDGEKRIHQSGDLYLFDQKELEKLSDDRQEEFWNNLNC